MRYIQAEIERTIQKERKMGFIAGPRQVGKTTLSQLLLGQVEASRGYFNWDIDEDRRKLLKEPLEFWRSPEIEPPSRIVLDEIHKFPRWKRFLKGFFDRYRGEVETIVTGSGRLDLHQKGGDSLFGRYHLYHLLPYSVGEMVRKDGPPASPKGSIEAVFEEPRTTFKDAYETLWNFNGFPEPLFSADTRALVRWRNDHSQLVLRGDLRDLTQIREIGLIESLVSLLPERIGSPLSVNALREDLGVNFKTAQNWLSVLDRLYYLFSLRPYSGRLARGLRREEKVYFYDWSELQDEGKRLENLVALHLLKACFFWTDAGYGDFRLHYVRDREKRETDFLVTERNNPFLLVEVKTAETEVDKSLVYFHERLRPVYAFQLVGKSLPSLLSKRGSGIYIASVSRFLAGLP